MSQASTPAKHRADEPGGDRSPGALEHEIEATRDRLADTLDELLFRVRPKTIYRRKMAELRAQFVDAQGDLRTEKVVAVAGAALGVVAFFVVTRTIVNRRS